MKTPPFITPGVPWKPGREGVPPSVSSGRDARSPRWYYGARLPHFDHPEAVQFITIRLFDSLPQERLRELELEKDTITDVARRKRIEAWLDSGYGACFLNHPQVGELVEHAFQHFHEERYWLHAWVVMPNHAHVLIELNGQAALQEILHSWKSFTSHEANKILQRRGDFWMDDYWDRFVRNQKHFDNAVEYAHQNPVKAKLVAQAEDWPRSSARFSAGSPGVPPGEEIVGRDAHPPRSPGQGEVGRDAQPPRSFP